MAVLAEQISIHGRFVRSVNVERDADRVEPLDGYIVTACALDVVERIATTAVAGESGGAWSLTGPYGSGKSSLALLLDAALGPKSTTRELAWRLIDEASSMVGELVRRTHRHRETRVSGFHRGVITANRGTAGPHCAQSASRRSPTPLRYIPFHQRIPRGQLAQRRA